MPPGTFSRSGMSVSLEESPPLPRKRQRLAEGGEDVKFNQRHYTVVRECGRNFKTSRALSPNGLGAFFMVGWNPTFLDVEAPRGLESEITHSQGCT